MWALSLSKEIMWALSPWKEKPKIEKVKANAAAIEKGCTSRIFAERSTQMCVTSPYQIERYVGGFVEAALVRKDKEW